MEERDERYDVAVIGGAFAGASLAILLRRSLPAARVLIVERAERFGRKVGEATVEVSGHFLTHVLKVGDLLAREHLHKHGLRFWFTDREDRRLSEMTESGTRAVPSLISYQLDRSRLDESLLALALREGADLLRPAKVSGVELGWPESSLVVEHAGGERRVRARWIVDASGRQAFLARRMKLLQKNAEHPTAAAWGRWKGVLDLDGPAVLGSDPCASRLPPIYAARRLATNHFCGHGWWCWVIPLSGGETSVGLVWDKRHFRLPEGPPREAYEAFLRSRAGLRELLAEARLDGEDFQTYDQLAYRSTRYIDKGWALVGDAASFLDPFYSPGLDHVSISVFATARILRRELAGELAGAALDAAVAEHDAHFQHSYDHWFRALYQDKYEIMGDAQLMTVAFFLDTAMYYLGVVHPAYARTEDLALPVLGQSTWKARLAYRALRFYNQRLVAIARARRARGTYGRHNVGQRFYETHFGTAQLRLTRAHRRGLAMWMRAELDELRERLGPRSAAAAPSAPAALPREEPT